MASVGKEEVNSLFHLLDVYCLLCSRVLQNELLQEEEGPAVGNMLSNLNCSNPLIRVCLDSSARVAHMFLLGEFHDIRLLEDGSMESFFLDSDLYFDSL